MVKNQKWKVFLTYESVRSYLNGSIGSKKATINGDTSLEDKISNVNLSNYLLGLKYFLEYSKEFNYPYEIIDKYESIRKESKKVNEFKQNIEDFTSWILNEKGKSEKTSINYQSQLRGFLRWNNIMLKFSNKKATSEKQKQMDKLGITFEEFKEISFKLIEYAKDFELKLLLRWLQVSGLGSREILDMTIEDLRYKDYEKEFVRLSDRREKTGVKFVSFLYGDVKREVKKYMDKKINLLTKRFEEQGLEEKEIEKKMKEEEGLSEEEAEKKIIDEKINESLLIGETNDPKRNYDTLVRRFSRTYNRLIENEYPKYKRLSKKLFTLHSYRKIFVTICKMIRVPKSMEDLFVAHTQSNLDEAYVLESGLIQNFKMIQEELFGITETSDREAIIKEFTENLMSVLANRGKSKTLFDEYGSYNEHERNMNFTQDIYTNVLVEKLLETAKDDLLNDSNFINALANKIKKNL